MCVPLRRTQLVLHGELPDPPARRRKDGVRHRGHDRRRAGLADAARRLGALDQMNFDRGRLAQAQHPIVVEVVLLDATVLDRDLAPQDARDPEDDAALHLRLHDVRVHDGAAVHDPPHPARSAASSSTALARGEPSSSARRYSNASRLAAAASSSMKLSTTKMLRVGPTPRQNAVGTPGGSWRTYSTRMLGSAYGGSAAPSTASVSRPFIVAITLPRPSARITRRFFGKSSLTPAQ